MDMLTFGWDRMVRRQVLMYAMMEDMLTEWLNLMGMEWCLELLSGVEMESTWTGLMV